MVASCDLGSVSDWKELKVHSYSAATQLRYWWIDYLSTTAQDNTLHLDFTSLQTYCNKVVRAEMEIRPLQPYHNTDAMDYERSFRVHE